MPPTPARIDGYAPIESYAMIGNKRTAALVATDGSIDWFCPQGFDRPSVLGSLLDSGGGGVFSLAPAVPFDVERRYRPQTNVLETTFTTADGAVRVTDAMSLPAARALDFNEIVRRIEGLSGSVPMRWRVAAHFDYGRRCGEIEHRAGVPLIVHDGHVLAIQAHGAGEPQRDSDGVSAGFTCTAGDVAILAVSSFDTGPVALADAATLSNRIESTAEYWERWSAGCTYAGRWSKAVLRSALTLDLMVDAATGAIVAAPTMGLPERVGGPRNYDYRYAWLRDGTLTLEAMLRLGYGEQVHASLRWMFAATERTHPWLRPMYRIDGHATLPDTQLDLDGYRGSRPVTLGNPAQSQLQLGCYGHVFEMAWRYVQAGNLLATGVAVRLGELADFVCRIWDRPDAGLWELSDPQHYTQSKLACALALGRAGQLAGVGMISPEHATTWATTRDKIHRYLHEHCWSDRLEAYTRAAGSEELDAAVLHAARGGLLAEEPERLSGTVDAILSELGAGGPLVYRYTGMRDQEGAFLACSFWAVEALAICGRLDEAESMMEQLIGLGNDVGLYAEEIDSRSMGFLGNMPLALSHLALVNAADVVRARRAASDGRAA